MLRIRRLEQGACTIFAISGRIEEQNLVELQKLLEEESEPETITLDLEEVRLVDRECVKFFAAWEARGVRLKDCPSFIRQWIDTGSDKSHER